ncbi:hypothetical protein WG926_14580 [Tistrella sp. BH-R2-4]|uniref:Ribbon-helix-helix protein CopG domain-containing protein n=1 Tax=Tistrella arctica TaxID=3133430 RepID=A0ABU9YL68_9PROT
MTERKRPRLFSDDDATTPETAGADPLRDLSDFRPGRRPADDPRATRDLVRPVAEESGFRSRDPRNWADDTPRPRGRPPGPPTVAVSLRVNVRTAALLDQIAADREWTKTRTFERAVAALERLLAEGVDPKTLG